MPISKLIPSCTSKHQRKLKKNVYGKTWAQLIPCKIFSDTLKSRRFLIWSRKKNHKRTVDFDIECIYKCDRCCAFAVESSWLCLGFFFFPVLIFFEILFNIAKPENVIRNRGIFAIFAWHRRCQKSTICQQQNCECTENGECTEKSVARSEFDCKSLFSVSCKNRTPNENSFPICWNKFEILIRAIVVQQKLAYREKERKTEKWRTSKRKCNLFCSFDESKQTKRKYQAKPNRIESYLVLEHTQYPVDGKRRW